jgi:phosphoribosylamine--glycine ligase
MKILIVGSGGREHALVWRLAKSPNTQLFALPGNPGITQLATCIPSTDLSPQTILSAAQFLAADLTVIGPEAPLVAGVVDLFRTAHLPIVGPTSDNARLEGSKIHAKKFFTEHNIPTARFSTVDNSAEAATALNEFDYPVVIKADGLAAGKGVVIAQNCTEALAAYECLGPRVVIEEFLTGPEVSFIALTDGKDALPLLPCRDHKRIYDNDQGPNTGGMGAFCDASILTPTQVTQILDSIIRPTIQATNFTGFLYAGLMMTATGPKLLEYNVRLGDPETQPLMSQMDCDLAQLLYASTQGALANQTITWQPGASTAVVLAAKGYPATPRLGDLITGIEEAESIGTTVFQAGTKSTPAGTVTNGGRVLAITATGLTTQDAAVKAYSAVRKIHFEGMQYRTDIGCKAPNQL